MRLAPVVPELGGVRRRPDRLREVEPLLAGELVEVVGGVGRAALLHPGRVLATGRTSGLVPAGSSRSYNASMPGRVVSRRFIGREPELARIARRPRHGGRRDRHDGDRRRRRRHGRHAGSSTRRSTAPPPRRAARSSCVAARTARRTRHGRPSSRPSSPLLATRPRAEILSLLRRDAGPVLARAPGRWPPWPPGCPGHGQRPRGPGAPPAARPGGAAALARSGRCGAPGRHHARGPPRRRRRHPLRSPRSSPGSPAQERIALVLSYQPDRLTREHPLRENLAVIEAGLRPPVRIDLAPFARREIAGLIEGIEGERPRRRIVVLVAERSAGRRSSSRSWSRPAASCATRRSPAPSRTSSSRASPAARPSAAGCCGCSRPAERPDRP